MVSANQEVKDPGPLVLPLKEEAVCFQRVDTPDWMFHRA